MGSQLQWGKVHLLQKRALILSIRCQITTPLDVVTLDNVPIVLNLPAQNYQAQMYPVNKDIVTIFVNVCPHLICTMFPGDAKSTDL